jgi:hypothetical protein
MLDSVPHCSDPVLAELATPYCFGDADEGQRRTFELHLMECDVCWREVQRLDAAVGALRTDMALAHTLTVSEISGLLGLSAGLDRPLAGHLRHALIVSVLWALLLALPVLVEIAWRWDRYGGGALIAAPLVFAWMTGATLAALALGVRGVRRGRAGLAVSVLVMLAATAVVCAALAPFAPVERLVEARFQTYPVFLGYVKAVVHAWLVGPAFVLWPFLFVVVMQRQLVAGRHRAVLRLLKGDPEGVPPPGIRYPRVLPLTLYLATVSLYNWLGMAHLFDNLLAGPHTRLFMGLVMTKSALWLLLPAICLWWYAGCLNELKRECLAVLSLAQDDERRGS